MSWRAAGLLARGWRRSSRRWWGGTAASLAAVLTLILTVLGTFQGVDHATNERVRDFFTGDLRVTPGRPTAAPSVPFPDAAGTRDALASAAGPGAEVVMRLEAQFILSRRSLLEAYLEESERFGLGAPGTTPEQDFYGIGVIAGLPFQQQAVRASLQPHLVAGTLPGPDAAPDDEVQLVMSLGRYRDYLTPQERERLGDPPDPQALRLARFEVTAAVIDDSGPMRDLLRLPARVVAVYETQLDALDTFTILAPVE
ncbi:MAG TPA: hypothetical protein VFH47_07375, partial [Candidatus Thermoplasmatota archaeon]|nr:hypothetical protein [Candidatus Thermoplasmatota archaeon]